MGDIFGVLLTVLLLGANAFFVGSEFALISARRDRLEALAAQGKKQRRHGDPGRREPVADAGRRAAGHHDLLDPARPGRRARGRAPAGEAVRARRHPRHGCCTPCRSSSRWRSWWCCTSCSARWCRRTSRSPGPESTAMLLIPAYLVWIRAGPAVDRVLQLVRQHHLACVPGAAQGRTGRHRLGRRTLRDDRGIAVRGAAGPRGAQPADPGAADPQPGRQRRADAAGRDPGGAGSPCGSRADPRGRSSRH